MKNKLKQVFIGFACGILNGLFGSGGGVVAVPALEYLGIEPKKAHATSVALIFVLSCATAIAYLMGDRLDIRQAWEYIPLGFAGAVVGTITLKKISNDILRRIFGVIVLISAVRLLMK